VPSSAAKTWFFQTDTTQSNLGKTIAYDERNYPSNLILFRQDFVWGTTPTSGNPYINSTYTTLDPGQSYQVQKVANQSLDQYGNLLQMNVYDWGNYSTPARTYTNTYLTGSNYTSRYIFNRLKASTVTSGSLSTTLSQIYYDGEPGSCGGFTFTDPSTQPAPLGMHDTSYGINFLYRGMPGTVITPASTVCTNYDIGGNVTSSSTNGLTTTATTASGSDYAAYQNITYTFPTTANAGKIMAQNDAISGETVSYQYDSLNRLQLANGSGWTQTYTYDGFGNLTNRAGTGAAQSTTISTPANLTTNQLSGYTYDPNGNQISTGYAYDAENRIVQANAGAVRYGYDGQNKRIWHANFSNSTGDWLLTSDSISVFGIDGKMIGTYSPQPSWNNTQTQISIPFYPGTERVYFGRKLVAKMGGSGYLVSVAQDRLESVGKYYPFGEERNSPPLTNDNVKFASYTRDSATGLDYADQRYYSSTFGRFMSSDPNKASAGPSYPQSWNRYAYANADPANLHDPRGLLSQEVDGTCPDIVVDGVEYGCEDPWWVDGGGGGGGDVCPDGTPADNGCEPPDEPQQDCTIELWQRPTPSETPAKGRGVHTYLYITGTDYPNGFMIEAGPVKGLLTGMINPPGQGLAAGKWNASDPFNPSNTEVGSPVDDPGCEKTIAILNDVNGYNSGKKYPYAFLGTTNSNAFTFTLLAHVGLQSSFGKPKGFTPGWGQVLW
jgi:RHS repeat-associated protein